MYCSWKLVHSVQYLNKSNNNFCLHLEAFSNFMKLLIEYMNQNILFQQKFKQKSNIDDNYINKINMADISITLLLHTLQYLGIIKVNKWCYCLECFITIEEWYPI